MASKDVQRGIFIVFEGIDRCGKSTQAKTLVEKLNQAGKPTKFMRFPNRDTPTGQIINAYLTNKDVVMEDQRIHLAFALNRWEARHDILQTLQQGQHIVCDRYAFSGVAFTAAKAPDEGLPAPDTVLYLNLSIEDAKKRGQYGEERYETEEMQRKVKDLYETKLKDSSWRVIDANKTVKELEEILYKEALDVIEKNAGKPIATLWKK